MSQVIVTDCPVFSVTVMSLGSRGKPGVIAQELFNSHSPLLQVLSTLQVWTFTFNASVIYITATVFTEAAVCITEACSR